MRRIKLGARIIELHLVLLKESRFLQPPKFMIHLRNFHLKGSLPNSIAPNYFAYSLKL